MITHYSSTRSGGTNLRRWLAGVGIALLAVTAAGGVANGAPNTVPSDDLGPPNAASGAPVKVGFVTAEGGMAISLPETREAAEAAAAYANDHLAGLAGHPIEVVSCEDKSDGASATACANRFVEEGVVAVVAGQVANADLYMPILGDAGIPWIVEVGTGQVEATSEHAFLLTGGLIGQLASAASFAHDEGVRHLVLFGIDVPAFTGAFEAFGRPAFDAAGVEVEMVAIPPGTPDATPHVAAGFASGPEAVMLVVDATLCKALLPHIESVNVSDVPLLIPGLCTGPDVIESVGVDAVDGAILNGASVAVGIDDPEAELYEVVMAQYAPDTRGDKAGVGYVAMLGLVRAVNAADPGEVTPATTLDALRTQREVPLPGFPGETTFTCDGAAFSTLPALCSTVTLFATMDGADLVDFRAVEGTEFLS
jgi:branched-chain amino acid transport system substrate-binding protein